MGVLMAKKDTPEEQRRQVIDKAQGEYKDVCVAHLKGACAERPGGIPVYVNVSSKSLAVLSATQVDRSYHQRNRAMSNR